MSSSESDTSSLHTLPGSLLESLFITKGDRRFQTLSTEYTWPCDSAASRLELLMAAIGGSDIYDNGLYWEPYAGALEKVFAAGEKPVRILDLGSGMTSIWCVSMAQRFPQAEITGIDLIPSELSYLPPNVTIEIHDLLEGLPFPDDFFDLIHFRGGGYSARCLCSPSFDFVPDVARALKPGGIFLVEGENEAPDGELFFSRTTDNPLLDLLRTRSKIRADSNKSWQTRRRRRPDLETRLRNEPAFRDSVETTLIQLPLGAKLGQVDPASDLGSRCREALLLTWELADVAAGLDEAVIDELRRVDRMVLPEQDRGLYIHAGVIWAKKAQTEDETEEA